MARNSVRVSDAPRRARKKQRARDVEVFAHERWLDDRTADVYAALDARVTGDMAPEEADAAAVRALPLTRTGARPVEAMRDLRREELVAIRGAGRGWRRRV